MLACLKSLPPGPFSTPKQHPFELFAGLFLESCLTVDSNFAQFIKGPSDALRCEGLLIAKDRRTTTGLRQSPHRRWVKSPNPAGTFFTAVH
jgi:hypothetical protein